MGQKQSNKATLLCLWFDPSPKISSNKKLKKDLKHLMSSLKRKKEISVKLSVYSSFEIFQDLDILDDRIKSVFIITSGSLKNKIFEKFNSCLKVKGIIVYCFRKENHEDSFSLCPKTILITEKANEVITQIETLIKESISIYTNEKIRTDFGKIIINSEMNEEYNFPCYKYVFIDNLLKEKFSLCSVMITIIDLYSKEEYFLCNKLIKVERNSLSKIINYSNNGKTRFITENQLEEAIKLLKIDIDPVKDFELFKKELIREFILKDFLDLSQSDIHDTYIQHFENIDKIEEFFHMIFYLFTINLNNNPFFLRINNLLKKMDFRGLSQFKHIFSAIIINFFPQFSKKSDNQYNEFYHEIYLDEFDINDVKKCKILINFQFRFASIINNSRTNSLLIKKKTHLHKKILLQFSVSDNSYMTNPFLNLNEYSKLVSEKDVIFSPFARFSISHVYYDEIKGNYLIKLNIQENNLFNTIFPEAFIFTQASNNEKIYVSELQSYFSFLKHFYPKKEVFSIQAGLLNQLANYYYFSKDYNLALYFYEKLIKYSENFKNYGHYCINFNKIARVYEILGKYKNAIETYSTELEKLLIKKSSTNDINIHKELVVCYCNIASMYINTGDYKNALSYCEIAYQLYQFHQSKNTNLLYLILNLMGNVHLKINNLTLATDNYDKAINIINKLGISNNSCDYAILINNFAMNLVESKDYTKALELLFKSVEIKQFRNSDNLYLCNTYNNIGSLYINMRDYDLALRYFYDSLKIIDCVLGNQNHKMYEIYLNIAFCHYLRGEIEVCLNYYNKAINILIDIKPDNYQERIKKLRNLINTIVN